VEKVLVRYEAIGQGAFGAARHPKHFVEKVLVRASVCAACKHKHEQGVALSPLQMALSCEAA